MINWGIEKARSSSMAAWVAIGLLAIACVMIAPNYVTGQWNWNQPLQLAAVPSLKRLQTDGLTLPGWDVLEQQTVELGHKDWSIQALHPQDSSQLSLPPLDPETQVELSDEPLLLILRPQSDATDEPLVEWIDFNGLQTWTMDQRQTLTFALPPLSDTTVPVVFSAQYFRGWNREQTYAVLQWYAWPTGGSPNSSAWFWADQWVQWRDRQRMPWVAVTVLLPIEPLGDIAPVRPVAEAIAQTIQTALVHHIGTTDPA